MSDLLQETPVTENEDYVRNPENTSPEVVQERAGTNVRVCDALKAFDQAASTSPGINFGDFVANMRITLY